MGLTFEIVFQAQHLVANSPLHTVGLRPFSGLSKLKTLCPLRPKIGLSGYLDRPAETSELLAKADFETSVVVDDDADLRNRVLGSPFGGE